MLLPDDCRNVTYLALTADLPGLVVLSYNSTRAGASQNHIHCHTWVCPPPVVVGGGVSRRALRGDNGQCGFTHQPCGGYEGVPPGLPMYVHPVVGVVGHNVRRHSNPPPSSPSRPKGGGRGAVEDLGDGPGDASTAQRGMDNRSPPPGYCGSAQPGVRPAEVSPMPVNVHLFVRATKTARETGSAFRLGSSKMMGVFHSSLKEEMESLSSGGVMAGMLSDMSWEPWETAWRDVCMALETI